MSTNIFQWPNAAVIAPNNFKYKSLSSWSFNTAVGCAHSCRFCYVPEVSTNRMGAKLATHGVTDPDAQWGDYVGVRDWNEQAFLASLRKAETTPASELKPDGNRAVMFCSTTDPYQVLRGELGIRHSALVTRALELIRDRSTLNVRILTRSPLAKRDFDVMRSFGQRLLFGMSLPTLNDRLARIYEPHAPSPTQRLACLRAAKDAGLNIYVAVAPTYPECDAEDMRRTFESIAPLKPVTVFHEPINIRAENVARIQAHARGIGQTVNVKPFESRKAWLAYAIEALAEAQSAGADMKLPIHLWPDASMGSAVAIQMLHEITGGPPEEIRRWLESWWNRISEWPNEKVQR